MSYPNFPASSAGGSTKVPIPRLQKQHSEIPRKTAIYKQKRVSQACLSCRSRKIKCNGIRPRCSNCTTNPTPCVYASSRKDRLKTATLHNQDMIRLLRDLRHQVSSSEQDRIDSLLASVIDDVTDATATVHQNLTGYYREPTIEEGRGQANVDEEVDSSADLDLLDEGLIQTEEIRTASRPREDSKTQQAHNLHSRGASIPSELGRFPWGALGKDVGACKRHLKKLHERQSICPTLSTPVSKVNSYLDDEALEKDLAIEPLKMPQFETADRLVRAYMESVHQSFPFLQEKAFLDSFYDYYKSLQCGNQRKLDRNWQAILNLVFAIGAVYNCLTTLDRPVDEQDHLLYYSRAWSLSLRNTWWSSQPDIPHMQITGLLSFYHLSIGHINRSWNLIGMAVRSGFALGTQSRKEDRNTDTLRDNIMSRIWWAHYALERLVSALTGRPSLGFGDMCSIPLPLPLSSEDGGESISESGFTRERERPLVSQGSATSSRTTGLPAQQDRSNCTIRSGPANSSSYLNSIVQLGEITQNALALYKASAMSRSWESMQRTIANENKRLDAWASSLLEGLNFIHRPRIAMQQYTREQNILEILYNSTKILITQPCLCRFGRRISDQTVKSNDFDQRASVLCIDAAKSIAELLPDAVIGNISGLYESGPWWQMVYVIMQALVVLLLEVAYESMCFSQDHIMVMPSLKKLFSWLRIMRINNGTAVRAYSISLALLKKLASTIKVDMTDIISDDDLLVPEGPGPAHSIPTQTHSPYPNILNPIDDPQTSMLSSEAQIFSHKQQHHAHNLSRKLIYNVSQQSQYTHTSYLDFPVETSHLESSHGSNSEPNSYAFREFLLATFGFESIAFPGWFVANFDEQNLPPDEGAAQDKDQIEEGNNNH